MPSALLCSLSRAQDSPTWSPTEVGTPSASSPQRPHVPEGRDPAAPEPLGLSSRPAQHRFLNRSEGHWLGIRKASHQTRVPSLQSATAAGGPSSFERVLSSLQHVQQHAPALSCVSPTPCQAGLCHTHIADKEFGDRVSEFLAKVTQWCGPASPWFFCEVLTSDDCLSLSCY